MPRQESSPRSMQTWKASNLFRELLFAILPLSAAFQHGAQKPAGDCRKNQIKFPEKDKYVNKINEYRKLMIDGQQKNGKDGGNLPTGENVAEMEWSCDLERKATDALNKKCNNEPVYHRSGTTIFYHPDNEQEAIDVWLSEINNTNIDLHDNPEAYVKCRSKSELKNYCNLVRYDASRIGCAKKECDGKTAIICLTNKEPLKVEDVLYYWGSGACPKGSCRPPTYGCNHHIGLCFKPLPTTTMTTTVPIWKLECIGKLCRFIRA
ncbi:hypothetical protein Y032_0489g2364 [Ancylostoma ceylanicum]|uniref:SCP domain-containing protein n=2 Tax=Ancylostoma ceylanicum TaxID=53326 RepID=A0A016WV88_9BILA|nr:hypothetical protein Y032_0489g2364 [Ancylostoma ceylanicum]